MVKVIIDHNDSRPASVANRTWKEARTMANFYGRLGYRTRFGGVPQRAAAERQKKAPNARALLQATLADPNLSDADKLRLLSELLNGEN